MIEFSAEQMWNALASYQRYASIRGYGEIWKEMLANRSQSDCDKASDAAWLFAVTWLDHSSKDAWEAADCAFDSLNQSDDEIAKQACRQSAVLFINKAIEKHDSRKLMLCYVGEFD